MDDKHKLEHLLEHWMEHNADHVKSYLDWAQKAGQWGNTELASVLKEIAEENRKLDTLFERAKSLIK